ncbi:hypothetical protein BDY24DRAFT_412619 [Mrakia frigida]|uniref:uncharacterized protein n=1 Tax=Mrakia frigida TaxID=29902 RepID=UPI003FCC0883
MLSFASFLPVVLLGSLFVQAAAPQRVLYDSSGVLPSQSTIPSVTLSFLDSVSFEHDVPEECLRICDIELSGPACASSPKSDDCRCDALVLADLESCLYCVEAECPDSHMLTNAAGQLRTAAEFVADYEVACTPSSRFRANRIKLTIKEELRKMRAQGGEAADPSLWGLARSN